MAAIGGAYLGATVAVQAFSAAMDTATEVIRSFGSVLGSDQTRPSSSEAVGAVGTTAKTGAKIAGGVLGGAGGAALGASLGGPTGAVAGAVIGTGAGATIGGKALEPVVEAINVGNALLERQTDTSLGPLTIMARTQAQVEGLFKKIENDFKVDALTAEFATARGELGRAIQDLQVEVITEFGPYLIKLVDLLAKVVGAIPESIDLTRRAYAAAELTNDMIKNPVQFLMNLPSIGEKLDFIINGTEEIANNTRSEVDINTADNINSAIQDFFGTQNQFNNIPGPPMVSLMSDCLSITVAKLPSNADYFGDEIELDVEQYEEALKLNTVASVNVDRSMVYDEGETRITYYDHIVTIRAILTDDMRFGSFIDGGLADPDILRSMIDSKQSIISFPIKD